MFGEQVFRVYAFVLIYIIIPICLVCLGRAVKDPQLANVNRLQVTILVNTNTIFLFTLILLLVIILILMILNILIPLVLRILILQCPVRAV